MDEASALALVADAVGAAGDDAAVLGDLVVSTDMLHERTDFPPGTTRYTAGWRAVGASWSDVAAMGATPLGAVAVYAAPSFEADELQEFLSGATDVSTHVDGAYVGGDLDQHPEFTVVSTAIGKTDTPVLRSGVRPGDRVYVTGSLGRSGAAVRLFGSHDHERANELFRFSPRISIGTLLAPIATAMIDSSDGLARSIHQLATASGCGFALERASIPVHPAVEEVADGPAEVDELALFFGEDFELVFTAPAEAVQAVSDDTSVSITDIGRVTDEHVTLDGEALPNRGFTHGGD